MLFCVDLYTIVASQNYVFSGFGKVQYCFSSFSTFFVLVLNIRLMAMVLEFSIFTLEFSLY